VGSISKNASRTLTVLMKNGFFMRIPSKKINCAAILSQDAEKCKFKKMAEKSAATFAAADYGNIAVF
jgi:hypothetical protein